MRPACSASAKGSPPSHCPRTTQTTSPACAAIPAAQRSPPPIPLPGPAPPVLRSSMTIPPRGGTSDVPSPPKEVLLFPLGPCPVRPAGLPLAHHPAYGVGPLNPRG